MGAIEKLAAHTNKDVWRASSAVGARATSRGWGLDALAGRLVELSAHDASATLTIIIALVREAQLRRELAVWIGLESTVFHAGDAAESGVDLDRLPVVRLSAPESIPIAADLLVRSGAFALVVLDLAGAHDGGDLRLAMQTRLVGLAHHHATAIVCLTARERALPSLGSLVSLRAEARHRRLSDGRFACEIDIIKDKRGAASKHTELCRGPDGLC
ncbi:MAG: recombinase A [Planctomycetota bacterium]